jgi:hypothetical protein
MLGSVVQVHLSPPRNRGETKKEGIAAMQSLFLSARYNACNHFSVFVRPDAVKLLAYSGAMTMQKFLIVLLASMLTLVCATQAGAEREFPEQAKRGDMKGYEYPSLKIGDIIYRLSPGSRIFNRHNLIIMPASLQIQTAPIMYTLDIRGDLSSVWLLTDDEAAQHPLQ